MLNLDYDEDGRKTGQLTFTRDPMLSRMVSIPSVVSIVPVFARDREAVETFITRVYAETFNARIRVHYPVLMSIRDTSGTLLAATGFRPAITEPLFLEQYLDAPVETVLQHPRDHIVEIGNLASDGNGSAVFLFAALAAYLHHKGYTQAITTSTPFLERRFRQMGLHPRRHAKADPGLLLHGNEHWGSYYDSQPYVMSGSVTEGYRCLQDRMGAEYTALLGREILPRLHYKGTPSDDL